MKRSENGLLYLTENSNAVISGKVVGSYDYETHTIFVAEITEAITLSGERSVTYTYYFEHIKPKPEQKKSQGKVWTCVICGYQYEDEKEKIPFEELPDDWVLSNLQTSKIRFCTTVIKKFQAQKIIGA